MRLTGLQSHESSLWLRPRNVTSLTVRGIEMANTGDTEDVAGVTAEVWTPVTKLAEWKKASA